MICKTTRSKRERVARGIHVFQDKARRKRCGGLECPWSVQWTEVHFIKGDGERIVKKTIRKERCVGEKDDAIRFAESKARCVCEERGGSLWSDFRVQFETDIMPTKSEKYGIILRGVLNRFERICSPCLMNEIGRQVIEHYASQRENESVSPVTINNEVKTLLYLLKTASGMGMYSRRDTAEESVFTMTNTGLRDSQCSKRGTVYFLVCTEANVVKIGWSNNVKRRIASLRTQSPVVMENYYSRDGSRMDEKRLHHRFRQYRDHGEWFRIEGELAEFIGELT